MTCSLENLLFQALSDIETAARVHYVFPLSSDSHTQSKPLGRNFLA